MVQIRNQSLPDVTRPIDESPWFNHIEEIRPNSDIAALKNVFNYLSVLPNRSSYWSEEGDVLKYGLEIIDILIDLEVDQDTLIAGLLFRALREQKTDIELVRETFGQSVAKILDGVLMMANIGKASRHTAEIEMAETLHNRGAIRQMLVAMTDDVRVPLVKLAERTVALRAVKENNDLRQRMSIEVSEIWAPLAHRLGLAQIKWELEDLSFRYLKPKQYKAVATSLAETRVERVSYIDNARDQLESELLTIGVDASVVGRPKHIYSIWRKMELKNYRFDQLYDIRAFRILVDTIPECYTVLGVLHSIWKHVPNQFDDYITNPKPNGYRSLHTCVYGPEDKVIEVQVRTRAMHEEAELGVCAHWKYKGHEGGAKQSGYETKLEWLRSVLDWHEQIDGEPESGQQTISEDRVYVFTKAGHILDLKVGATVLDFAYRIHSDVGHTCRGAKVGGRIVPLTYVLKTGDRVEILTQKNNEPSRDWLNLQAGYIATSRARSKIIAWFKAQNRDSNEEIGRDVLEPALKERGIHSDGLKQLAKEANYKDMPSLYAAIGAGDVKLSHVLAILDGPAEPEAEKIPTKAAPKTPKDALNVAGIDNMMTAMASCCNPLPGDAIVGYVTVSKGVSVHRAECPNVAQLHQHDPLRIIDVGWREGVAQRFPVDIEITAQDRTSLLKDITTLLANEKVDVNSVYASDTENGLKSIGLTVSIVGLAQLDRLLLKIGNLPTIENAERKRSG